MDNRIQPIRQLQYGKMTVKVYENRDLMGRAATEVCAEVARRLLKEREEVNILFPCAFSHADFFKYFFDQPGIDWSRMNAFVMDEYLGLKKGSPYILSNFAKEHIFSRVPFKAVYSMDATNPDFDGECDRYASILKTHPLDMACLGIGETGHLAYNDPAVADFEDKKLVKHVEIDERSRYQAVHDGAFPSLDVVPHDAMTVTMPVMMRATYKQVIVPTSFKKEAVYRTTHDEISTACPATILRNYDCVLYTDMAGAELL